MPIREIRICDDNCDMKDSSPEVTIYQPRNHKITLITDSGQRVVIDHNGSVVVIPS